TTKTFGALEFSVSKRVFFVERLNWSPFLWSLSLTASIQEGDLVFLYQDARRNWIARAGEGRFHTHRGYLDLKDLVGLEYGVFVKTSLGQSLAVLKPRLLELVNSFSRPTQIMYPKDIGYAIYQLGLKDGSPSLGSFSRWWNAGGLHAHRKPIGETR